MTTETSDPNPGGESEDQVGTSLTKAAPPWFSIGCWIMVLSLVGGTTWFFVRLLT